MTALTLMVGGMGLVLLLPALSDLMSLVRLALAGRPKARVRTSADAPQRLLFLVPAHNEELLVGDCVRSLLAQNYRRDCLTVLVLADNCTDRTIEKARRAGAHTLERRDPARPGKPRAIAWALNRIALSEYDALVIVDADCVVDHGFAAALAAAGPLEYKAVQPYNDVRNVDDSPLTRLAALFAAARYRFAYPLKRAAGLNVPLSAGMCIGMGILRERGWTAFSLAEDWELYASLTRRRVRIDYAHDAHLYAQEAHTLRQSRTQRKRWMAGKMHVLVREGWGILIGRYGGWHRRFDALAELSAPGPAVHLGFLVGIGVATAALQPPLWPLLLCALGLGLVRHAVYAVAALGLSADPVRDVLALCYLPVYTLWRLGAAAATLMLLKDRPWLRSPRDQKGDGARAIGGEPVGAS